MQHQVPHDDYGMYHQTPPLAHLNFPSGTKHVEERQHMRSPQVVVSVPILMASLKDATKLQIP